MITGYSANLLLNTQHKCYQKRQSSSFLSVYVRCHSASAHCILSPLKSIQKKALMVTVALLWLTLCPKPLRHICIPICQIRSTAGSDVCVCVSVHVCLWECPIQQVQPFCIRLQCIVSTTLWFIALILVYSRARDLTWLQKTCWRRQRFDSKEPKSRVNVRCRGVLNLVSRVNH